MKKLICLLVTMCAMILMCSVAGAGWCDEHEWTYVSLGRWYHVKMCEVCGLSNDESHSSTDSWEYIDLGDRHRAVCKYCGEDMQQTLGHASSCISEDPSRCDICGISGISSENIEVDHQYETMNCGDYHADVCIDCGAKGSYLGEHYAYCGEDVTVCDGCGATDNITIRHIMGEYVNLGTQCQQKCIFCDDYKYEPMDHRGYCDHPDRCITCGFDGVPILPENLWHSYEYYDMGKQHKGVCEDCGDTFVENHEVMCDYTNECLLGCGLHVTEVEPSCIKHWAEDTVYERNATQHIRSCSFCGMQWEPINHFRTCDEKGICAECRMTVYDGAIISKTVHRAKAGTATYSAERHSFECADCGQYVEGQSHFFWYIMYDNECDECGYVYGSLPPTPVIPGDPTEDGVIDIMDALAILQYSVGWGNTIDQEAGDVNDDGSCDIMDALLILQYTVGWDVELK